MVRLSRATCSGSGQAGPEQLEGYIGLRTIQFKKRAPMREYHCFFLNAADQVAAILTISCMENEAQSRAESILTASDHVSVEVWTGGRRLYRSRKSLTLK
jgi:hypothetical protein